MVAAAEEDEAHSHGHAHYHADEEELGGELNEEEKQKLLGDGSLILPIVPQKKRNCCVRILRLFFCCDTSEFGSQAALNNLADQDIELYQKQLIQLELELQRDRKSVV